MKLYSATIRTRAGTDTVIVAAEDNRRAADAVIRQYHVAKDGRVIVRPMPS